MIIGIAGGIGSGKTSAAEYLQKKHGFELLDNDVTAREVVAKDSPVLKQISERFGQDILTEQGDLNRPALRQKIFNSQAEKEWLESVIHPEVRKRTLAVIESTPPEKVLLLVSPLMFETGQNQLCEQVVVISTIPTRQIERATKRDSVSAESVTKIMNQQITDQQRVELADTVIYNNDTLEALFAQLDNLAEQWKKKLK